MKRIGCLFFCLLLMLGGCAHRSGDWFAPFRAGFLADVEGELHGTPFSARIEAGAMGDGGVLPLTVTFYAPRGLCGTVLRQDALGNRTLSCGEMVLGEGIEGLGIVCELFPLSGEVQGVEVLASGHTSITGVDFCLELLEDGTPYRLERGEATVTVLRWENAS